MYWFIFFLDPQSRPDLTEPAPELPPRPERAPAQVYIAMFDYIPTDDSGLELIEVYRYLIL